MTDESRPWAADGRLLLRTEPGDPVELRAGDRPADPAGRAAVLGGRPVVLWGRPVAGPATPGDRAAGR